MTDAAEGEATATLDPESGRWHWSKSRALVAPDNEQYDWSKAWHRTLSSNRLNELEVRLVEAKQLIVRLGRVEHLRQYPHLMEGYHASMPSPAEREAMAWLEDEGFFAPATPTEAQP